MENWVLKPEHITYIGLFGSLADGLNSETGREKFSECGHGMHMNHVLGAPCKHEPIFMQNANNPAEVINEKMISVLGTTVSPATKMLTRGLHVHTCG